MPETRTPFIAGNWKMFKARPEARAFVEAIAPGVPDPGEVEVAVCAPFTSLADCVAAAGASPLRVYAQNMHDSPDGAFTGEVSAPMLVETGVDGVVLGHSERRELFGETDRALGEKVPAALAAGLHPILCVGETEHEREQDQTQRKLRQQVQDDLGGLDPELLSQVVIAYEPIWAIGTGKVASADQAQEAVAFVRALVGDIVPEAAERVRILYGGSVKPGNAAELLAQPDIDGALVGGASLEPDSLMAIVEAARG